MAKLGAAKKPPAELRPDSTDPKAARQAALKLLARRDFSSGELQKRLAERGFNSEVVTTVIADLKRERLLNDARYLEHFIAYHAGRGQGPIRIRQELQRQGMDADPIDGALTGGGGEGIDWLARARELRRKKFGAELPESYADKAKQARFLQYRGFTGAQIRAALDTQIEIDPDTHTDRDDT